LVLSDMGSKARAKSPAKSRAKSLIGPVGNISAATPVAWMARFGYLTRGVVFLLVGGVALLVAAGAGAQPQGARGALQTLFEQPLGGLLLWSIAFGLACFAAWRFLQSLLDADRLGANIWGMMRRGAYGVGGLFYLALAAAAARIGFAPRTTNEEQAARDWTHWLMIKPLGRSLIALLAAVVVGVAIGIAVNALRASYRRKLDAKRMPIAWAVAVGSFGMMTRAFVFLMIGIFLGLAAYDYNSREVVGLGGVLNALQHQAYGKWVLAVAALGLLAFGCFELIEAYARRVRAPKLATK
jgi:Domain of Unknown Function (DUF1206)